MEGNPALWSEPVLSFDAVAELGDRALLLG